MEITTDLGRN